MKNLLLIAFVVSALCGCASTNEAAYKTLGSITIAVNTAKHAYEEFRAYNKITPEQDAKVRIAYEKYQGAVRVARDLQKSLSETKDKALLEQVAASVQAVAAEFLALIGQTTPQYRL